MTDAQLAGEMEKLLRLTVRWGGDGEPGGGAEVVDIKLAKKSAPRLKKTVRLEDWIAMTVPLLEAEKLAEVSQKPRRLSPFLSVPAHGDPPAARLLVRPRWGNRGPGGGGKGLVGSDQHLGSSCAWQVPTQPQVPRRRGWLDGPQPSHSRVQQVKGSPCSPPAVFFLGAAQWSQCLANVSTRSLGKHAEARG